MKTGQIIYQGLTKKNKPVVVRYPTRKNVIILLDSMKTLSKKQSYILFQGKQLKLKEEQKYLKDFLKKIKENKAVKLLTFYKDKLVAGGDITPPEAKKLPDLKSVAYNLYRQFGFIEFGRLPKGILHKNQYVDRLEMYKNIED